MALDAKAGAQEALKSAKEQLVDLSHRIHANPELGYEEERAADWLCELLADAGLGAHPRRDDGHRRRLHGRADELRLP